jgi:hypothetical protein
MIEHMCIEKAYSKSRRLLLPLSPTIMLVPYLADKRGIAVYRNLIYKWPWAVKEYVGESRVKWGRRIKRGHCISGKREMGRAKSIGIT